MGSGITASAAIKSSARVSKNAEIITSANEKSFVSTLDSEISNRVDPVTGLTYNQVLKLFKEFQKQRNSTLNSSLSEKQSEKASKVLIDDFVNYTVNRGMISNTIEAKSALSKDVMRGLMTTVAETGIQHGYVMAGAFLLNSLQDNPSNLSLSSGSDFSNEVKDSSEWRKIVSDYKSYVKGANLSGYGTMDSTAFNSNLDLLMALHAVDYYAHGSKSGNTWDLTIDFSDTYDFAPKDWKSANLGHDVAAIINNVGVYAQSVGAIVPYDISIETKTSFIE